jgi:mannose-1-phosphate guanylyltransferase
MSTGHWHALILAGGRGTRFWPRSRTRRAKQVLEFLGHGTMIQQTAARLEKAVPPERTWVLTNQHLRAEIARQLPRIPRRQIIAEPAQRNTAPAIGMAAKLVEYEDPGAVLGVFPSDHHIAAPGPFLKLVRAAYREAARGRIALIGIQPRWAETGYGYLEFAPGTMKPGSAAAGQVVRFREKPDEESARAFVEAGHYAWNAGMFFWRAGVLLEQLRRHLPRTAAAIDGLPPLGSRKFKAELARRFPQCENVSVDYAVLEKAEGVVAFVAGAIGWSDAGSWNAVYELLNKNAGGNVARNPILAIEARGNYVDAPGKFVALLGVEALVIVDAPDALLVARRGQAQRVNEVVKALERARLTGLL